MGPIVRAKDFIPQLHQPYQVTEYDFAKGFYLIVSGLFKKLVISDYLTLNLVNYVFDDPARHTGLECTVALLAYAIVIYCDFSGYSDVAIGIARWLGIVIPPNFASPYQSKSITEFWRRWHISLSSWLKDYLYIFWLKGNRKGNFRTYVNLSATMLLGGFWHGANWTFIIWGAMHGGALAFHKVYMEATKRFINKLDKIWLYRVFAQLLTFLFVCLCWVFFKASNVHVALDMFHQIGYNFSFSVWGDFFENYHNVIYLMLLGYALHLIPDGFIEKVLPRFQKAPLVAYIAIFLVFIVIYSQFKSSVPVMPIYLQF
jgi:D-alanyl-lipoteichoic acid acyltransferase DltB (MBOAT superfamily)